MAGGFLAKIFGNKVKETIDSIGDAIDKNVTSEEERLKIKQEITALVSEFSTDALEIQKEVILTEMNGNTYQRSWRPSLMYMAMFILFSTWFLFPLLNIWAQDPNMTDFISELKTATDFWDIIKLGVGAFGIGRSVEKISKDVVNNVDVSLKKKNK